MSCTSAFSTKVLFAASAMALMTMISSIQPLPAYGQAADAKGFTFALIGDLGYYPEHETWLDNVHAEINKDSSLAFVVHDGDLSRPNRACTEELLKRRLAQFDSTPHPFIFTPGDNDWTDCHDKQGVKGGDPLAALTRLRTMFFAGEEESGTTKIAADPAEPDIGIRQIS